MSMKSLYLYGHLFKWLFMPNRFNYWLFIICIVSGCIAGISSAFHVIWPAGVFLLVFTLWFVSGLLSLSGQLIALGSCRQFGLLPLIRTRMLIIYWAANIVLILIVATLIHVLHQHIWLTALAIGGSMCIFLSVLFIWINAGSKLLAPIMLFILFISSKWIYSAVSACPLLSGLFAIALASGFSYWWYQWRPVKRVNNVFLIRSLDKVGLDVAPAQNYFLAQLLSKFFPSKVNNLHGVLLKGGPDTIQHRAMIWFLGLVMMTIYGLISTVLIGASAIKELTMVTVPILLWSFLLAGGLGLPLNIYRNLGRTWLYFPGSKRLLLHYIEKIFYRDLLLDTVAVCVIACVYLALLDKLTMAMYVVPVYMLGVLAMQIFSYYASLYIHLQTSGSYTWYRVFMFVYIAIVLIGLGVVYFNFANDGQILWVLGAVFIVLFLGTGLVLRVNVGNAIDRLVFLKRHG